MYVMLMLLVASLIVALIFLAAFLLSNSHGQYDDYYGPPHRMLNDDYLHD